MDDSEWLREYEGFFTSFLGDTTVEKDFSILEQFTDEELTEYLIKRTKVGKVLNE